MKVTIIGGAGKVGSTIAFALYTFYPQCRQINLIDIDKKKLEGEFRDLRHGAYNINKKCKIQKGNYKLAKQSDAIIITAGYAWNPVGKLTHEDLYELNYPIIKKIVKRLPKCGNKIYLVTNPPEKMTLQLWRDTGILINSIGYELDHTRKKIDNIQGHYILNRKNHSNWGIAGQVLHEVIK